MEKIHSFYENVISPFIAMIGSTIWLTSIFFISNILVKKQIILTDITYIIFWLLLPIVLSAISFPQINKEEKISILEIELADNEFLPNYLGYFFVGIGTDKLLPIIFIQLLLIIFIGITRFQYFNPSYLIFGYHYYHMKTKSGARILVALKGSIIKRVNGNFAIKLSRINDTTFIGDKDDNY